MGFHIIGKALPKFQLGMTSMSHANKSSAPHARSGSGCDLTAIEKWETDDRHMAFSSMDERVETLSKILDT